jgi:hypothetical protein
VNKHMITNSIVQHFRQSGYRVLGIVRHNGPVGVGRQHMWKKGGDD